MTVVARGWPPEYGGPYPEGTPVWAARPKIIEDDGVWVWRAEALFLLEDAIRDLAKLEADGWMIHIRSYRDQERVQIRIREREDADAT